MTDSGRRTLDSDGNILGEKMLLAAFFESKNDVIKMTDGGYDGRGSVSPVAQPRGRFCAVYLQTEASFHADFLVLVADTFTVLPQLHCEYLRNMKKNKSICPEF